MSGIQCCKYEKIEFQAFFLMRHIQCVMFVIVIITGAHILSEYPKYEVIFKCNAPQGEIPVGLNNENKKHDSSQGEHIERNVHGAALIHTAANMFLPVLPSVIIVSLLMFPKVELDQVPA